MSEITKAKVMFRLKGQAEGPIYQGQEVVQPCRTCGGDRAETPERMAAYTRAWQEAEARHAAALAAHPLRASMTALPVCYEMPVALLPASARPAGVPQLVLPVPQDQPRLKIEIHTLRFGDADWLQECSATMDDWAARNDLPLHVWGDPGERYPAAKFCEVDMLRQFLAGDSDWMMYFDADVYFHPLAPAPHFEKGGFHIMPDQPSGAEKGFVRWVRRHYGQATRRWRYRNAGVWACDRASAAAMLEQCLPPFIAGWQEQHQWNYWLMMASRAGLSIRDLSPDWNHWPKDNSPGWAFHLAGLKKKRMLESIRRNRLLPQRAEAFSDAGPAMTVRAVVYPWRSNAAKWEELKMSLRSIEQNFADRDCPIYILGDRAPEWLIAGGRVRFIEAHGYAEALAIGLQLAEKVLWMNDDIALLQNMDWEDFETPRHLGEMSRKRQEDWHWNDNGWKRSVARAMVDLAHRGKGQLDFETHVPYLWEREKVLEVLRIYGVWHKVPFATLYGNHHGIAALPLEGWRSSDFASKSPILNFVDRQLTPEFKEEYEARFQTPAAWERLSGHPSP